MPKVSEGLGFVSYPQTKCACRLLRYYLKGVNKKKKGTSSPATLPGLLQQLIYNQFRNSEISLQLAFK